MPQSTPKQSHSKGLIESDLEPMLPQTAPEPKKRVDWLLAFKLLSLFTVTCVVVLASCFKGLLPKIAFVPSEASNRFFKAYAYLLFVYAHMRLQVTSWIFATRFPVHSRATFCNHCRPVYILLRPIIAVLYWVVVTKTLVVVKVSLFALVEQQIDEVFDTSGHVLVSCIAILFVGVELMYLWIHAGAWKRFWLVALPMVGIWVYFWVMLLITCLYFHSFAEKVLASLFANVLYVCCYLPFESHYNWCGE